ncbi:MAG: type II toxin-antitoxin system RelE/ParE family toxin [Candidatus Liptonbacteria bacterium]|nr:type II toxin-antitoxin system RelE/ParE family toxin [Candidatus Liptonbacteria bacterium]
MNWQTLVAPKARKEIAKLPSKDLESVKRAIDTLAIDPFLGDIQKLGGDGKLWRKRIGSYRIFYETVFEKRIVIVHKVKRRTSKTY